MKINLSIIIPVYNREDTIERCINSIFKQRHENVEVIIINDGSTDSTKKIISKYMVNSKVVYLELPQNMGVNYARNRGIEKATGEFILFLDSDDYLVESALDRIKFYLNNYSKYEHFLFVVYDKVKIKNSIIEESNYIDWLSNKYSGDYTHIISSQIVKKYLFFENFIDAEDLNWYRIYKEYNPQVIINEKIVIVEIQRLDSLMLKLKLSNINSITDKYSSNDLFIRMYLNDFIENSINYIFRIIYQNIILGIILKKFKGNLKYFLILNKNKKYVFPFKIINHLAFSKLFFLLVWSKSKLS